MSAQSRKSAPPVPLDPSASVESVLRHMDEERAELVSQLAGLQHRLEQLETSKALLLTYIGSSDGASLAPAPAPATRPVGATESAVPDEPATAATVAVPGARRSSASSSRRAGGRAARQGTTGRGKGRKKSAAAKVAAPARGQRGQTIVEYLAEHGEPRSATEVTNALQERHTDQEWSRAGVRESLEHLVSKNQAQRTTQGRSVFYSAAPGATASDDAAAKDAEAASESQPEAAAAS
ncbi:BlaI/MecI/CopY family transcriptional regulator [Streptomyces sp. 71268]|uniref:BlaI/MecI/CopY family transcriptional regulator n=1 Tax=Streptomyces sp. 71268 TaxID=3002640 RepID=UPI0023F66CE0|nr:BlaI/MecI/CopY family transcriptional regulator [Streptomyces sp. 71268]WEV29528.1 BlaI/MecI/CopY family transcriptional regulator [Streptomyces sp. 71268]